MSPFLSSLACLSVLISPLLAQAPQPTPDTRPVPPSSPVSNPESAPAQPEPRLWLDEGRIRSDSNPAPAQPEPPAKPLPWKMVEYPQSPAIIKSFASNLDKIAFVEITRRSFVTGDSTTLSFPLSPKLTELLKSLAQARSWASRVPQGFCYTPVFLYSCSFLDKNRTPLPIPSIAELFYRKDNSSPYLSASSELLKALDLTEQSFDPAK